MNVQGSSHEYGGKLDYTVSVEYNFDVSFHGNLPDVRYDI